MIINHIQDIKERLKDFKDYGCIVIICKYNGGKSSIATGLIHEYFGEEDTYYATFIDQNKVNFTARKARLRFDEVVKGKVVIFDEISDEKGRNIKDYLKKLIANNLVIILSNPYGSTNDAEKEINLFNEHEKDILPDNTLFIFVKN